MFKINDNYLKLPGSYLFSTIAKRMCSLHRGKSGRENHPSWNRRRNPADRTGDH